MILERIDMLLESKTDAMIRELERDLGIEIEVNDWFDGQVLFYHENPYVYMKFRRPRDSSEIDPHCAKQAEEMGRDIWKVEVATLDDDYVGQGFGLRFYMLMAQWAAERGGVLAPSICTSSGNTNTDAMRVWKALRRRGFDVVYPEGV